MKFKALLVGVILSLLPAMLPAQTASVPATLNISWKLPTTATDGTALAGPLALTKLQVWVSQSPIQDATASAPSFELGPELTTTTYTTSAPNGSTLYVRMKACNIGGCSALSAQGSKAITVPAPGLPTDVQVQITIRAQ